MSNELEPFDDAMERVQPTPEDWGFPGNPRQRDRTTWHRQEMFLEAYSKIGRITQAAEASGITRWCVDKWLQTDKYSIRKRLEFAHAKYVEAWEQAMDARLENPTGNRGSDVLMMFKMKAIAPEKYREEVKVVGSDPAMALLDKLKAIERDWQKQQALERGEVVEGEVRELPPGEGR